MWAVRPLGLIVSAAAERSVRFNRSRASREFLPWASLWARSSHQRAARAIRGRWREAPEGVSSTVIGSGNLRCGEARGLQPPHPLRGSSPSGGASGLGPPPARSARDQGEGNRRRRWRGLHPRRMGWAAFGASPRSTARASTIGLSRSSLAPTKGDARNAAAIPLAFEGCRCSFMRISSHVWVSHRRIRLAASRETLGRGVRRSYLTVDTSLPLNASQGRGLCPLRRAATPAASSLSDVQRQADWPP